jgi:hypothetical protein
MVSMSLHGHVIPIIFQYMLTFFVLITLQEKGMSIDALMHNINHNRYLNSCIYTIVMMTLNRNYVLIK